ncbi:hypothetical protein [Thiorhodococcus minor]|uniref:hypothetical protein n=1 Tax=Thiorhodococcus minor TaxID=57489 RepID=UPI001FD74C21|nr:hypothetical protein [Thiorhodococcus minor]
MAGQRNIAAALLRLENSRRPEDIERMLASLVDWLAASELLDPKVDEAESRRQWKRRAFDHLLTLALTGNAAARVERADPKRQRDLLRRKLTALEHGGWSFAPADAGHPDPAALQADLDKLTAQLNALGADQDVLRLHLQRAADLLGAAPRQLWAEPVRLWLDDMNIQREADDPTARAVQLWELRNARDRRGVMLALSITPDDLPVREDLVTAAQRYLQ